MSLHIVGLYKMKLATFKKEVEEAQIFYLAEMTRNTGNVQQMY